jgi:putative CocE/NonD family hydrolase
MLKWLHYVMNNKMTDDADFRDKKKWDSVFSGWYKEGASFRSLDTLEGRPNYIFQRWLQHPSYDSYWQSMTPQKQEFAKINIPILTTTGYWDDDQLGAMYYYRQYHEWNKNPDYYLIIGPYDHGGSQYYPSKKLAGYQIDSVANIPIIDIVFQWFDHVLKDSSLPAILKNRVNFEVMGLNQWKHVRSLDEMHNDSLTFYFGNLSDRKQYPLLKTRPTTPGYIAQEVDLADRNYGRVQSGDIDAFPLIIDSVLNPEKEKLIFVSDPIDNPFAISGALTASIVASINKKDIDLVLDLYEETPEGKFFALNQTLQRASYAKDPTKRQLLEPGKIETILLSHTFLTSKQLQKGSRIVITIGVNKSPSWQMNYGTGKDVSEETIKDVAVPLEIKWYNNSYIKLPVLR